MQIACYSTHAVNLDRYLYLISRVFIETIRHIPTESASAVDFDFFLQAMRTTAASDPRIINDMTMAIDAIAISASYVSVEKGLLE